MPIIPRRTITPQEAWQGELNHQDRVDAVSRFQNASEAGYNDPYSNPEFNPLDWFTPPEYSGIVKSEDWSIWDVLKSDSYNVTLNETGIGIDTTLDRIGNSNFYATPYEPVDPWDCERWPNSPYCGGNYNPFQQAINVLPVVSSTTCETCFTFQPSFLGVDGPITKVCYRKDSDFCQIPPPKENPYNGADKIQIPDAIAPYGYYRVLWCGSVRIKSYTRLDAPYGVSVNVNDFSMDGLLRKNEIIKQVELQLNAINNNYSGSYATLLDGYEVLPGTFLTLDNGIDGTTWSVPPFVLNSYGNPNFLPSSEWGQNNIYTRWNQSVSSNAISLAGTVGYSGNSSWGIYATHFYKHLGQSSVKHVEVHLSPTNYFINDYAINEFVKTYFVWVDYRCSNYSDFGELQKQINLDDESINLRFRPDDPRFTGKWLVKSSSGKTACSIKPNPTPPIPKPEPDPMDCCDEVLEQIELLQLKNNKVYNILGGDRWFKGGESDTPDLDIDAETAINTVRSNLYRDDSQADSETVSAPDMISLLAAYQAVLYQRAGFHRFPAIVPENLALDPDAGDDPDLSIVDAMSWQEWLVKQIDALQGAWPIKVKYKDEEGEESTIELHNNSEAIAEIYGLLLSVAGDVDIQTELGFKTITEAIAAKVAATTAADYAKGNAEFLGYKGNLKEKKIPLSITPGAKTLKKALETSEQKVPRWVNEDKLDLVQLLTQILFATEVVKSVFWDTFDPDRGVRGEGIKERREQGNPGDEESWQAFIDELRNPTGIRYSDLFPKPDINNLPQEERDGN